MTSNREKILQIYTSYWIYANHGDPYVNLNDFNIDSENVLKVVHDDMKKCGNFAFEYYRKMVPYIEFFSSKELTFYLKKFIRRQDIDGIEGLEKLLENNKKILDDNPELYKQLHELFSRKELQKINSQYLKISMIEESFNLEDKSVADEITYIKTLSFNINKKLILKDNTENQSLILKSFNSLLERIESVSENKKLLEIEKFMFLNHERQYQVFFVNPKNEDLINNLMINLIDFFNSEKPVVDDSQIDKFQSFIKSLKLSMKLNEKLFINKNKI